MGGPAVGVVALAVAQERVPVAVLGLGVAGFLVRGVFELPLLVRYLLVPGAMIAPLCAAGLAAPAWIPPGRRRRPAWSPASSRRASGRRPT